MEHQEWLTINYSLPKEPSRVRVNVWRKLKKSGAVILGQSVWFLPVSKENEACLEKISDEVIQNNGTCYLMRMTPQDEGTSARITLAFNQARDDEYAELLEQCDDLVRELEKESALGKFTFRRKYGAVSVKGMDRLTVHLTIGKLKWFHFLQPHFHTPVIQQAPCRI